MHLRSNQNKQQDKEAASQLCTHLKPRKNTYGGKSTFLTHRFDVVRNIQLQPRGIHLHLIMFIQSAPGRIGDTRDVFFSFYTRLFPRLKSSLYTVMALVTKPTGQSTVICIIGAHALPNARMGTLIISFGLRGPHFPGKQTLPGAHWLHVNTCLIPVEQISYISTYSTGIKSIDLQSRSAQFLIKLSFV